MVNNVRIYFKKLSKKAVVPKYAKVGDACCDLSVIEDYTIKPGQRCLARTGLAIEVPEGFEAQVRPRSGLAWEKGLTVVNTPGTIDAGYRGEIKIALINLGNEDIVILKGDRVAQMKFAAVFVGHFLDVGENELNPSVRGTGGFGHSGS
jgi:dUTP pyrophosphatase